MVFAKPNIDNYSYERHSPEESLLYQVVAKNLEPFFKKCEESGHHVPKFVRREFEAFLRCGVLSYGFARVYCQSCKYDRLVPFSCKRRGFLRIVPSSSHERDSRAIDGRSDSSHSNSTMGVEPSRAAALSGGLRQRCAIGSDVVIYGIAFGLSLPGPSGNLSLFRPSAPSNVNKRLSLRS